MTPFFYIIVVCYNAGDTLLRTLESIAGQSFKDYMVFIKDGSSSDGSVERAAEKFDIDKDTGLSANGQIQLVSQKDEGIYDAMNAALKYVQSIADRNDYKKAIGPFVYFLNCGDYFADDEVLQTVYNGIVNEYSRRTVNGQSTGSTESASDKGTFSDHRDIFYGNIYERLTGQNVTSNPHIDDFALYRNVPCHQACFYDMQLMIREHFDTSYRIRADYEHFLRCWYIDGTRTCYLPVTIADYEGGGFSESGDAALVSERERKEIVRKYMPAGRVFKYDLIRALTLAPLRTRLERNPKTSRMYNRLRSFLYRK